MSDHVVTVHDPLLGTDRRVRIAIEPCGQDQWRFHAHFEGDGHVLASGDFLWSEREDEILALAEKQARENARARAR